MHCRIRTAGQLQAATSLAMSAEADFVRDRAHLNEETARLQRELSDNLKSLSEEKRRARDAAITLDAAQTAAQLRWAFATTTSQKRSHVKEVGCIC